MADLPRAVELELKGVVPSLALEELEGLLRDLAPKRPRKPLYGEDEEPEFDYSAHPELRGPFVADTPWTTYERPDGGEVLHRVGRYGEEVQELSATVVKSAKFRPSTKRPISKRWLAGVVGVFDGREAMEAGDPTFFLDTVQITRHKEDWQNERDDLDNAYKAGVEKELRKNGYSKQADRLGGCGSVLGRKICVDCSDGTLHTSQCGQHHLCPTCARIASQRLKKKLLKHFKRIEKRRGYGLKLGTMTYRTLPGQWKEALRVCAEAFGKIWRMHLKAPGAGAFRSMEFGYKNGNIHVHFLYYGPYINQGELAKAWERYTKGSYRIKIQAVREDKGKGKLIDPENEVAFDDAISEVVKYCTKMGEVGPKKLVQFWVAMKGRRMTQPYGVFLGIPTEKKILEKPVCEVCGCTRFFYYYNDPGFSKEERGP